jgi:hypothetical protein
MLHLKFLVKQEQAKPKLAEERNDENKCQN